MSRQLRRGLPLRPFAEAAVSTLVLEAGYVSRGSTAASSALLPQEPDKSLGELSRRYGQATGKRLWQLTREVRALPR